MYIRYGLIVLTAVMLSTVAIPAFAADMEDPPDWLLQGGTCLVTKLKAKDYPDWQVCHHDREGQWHVFIGMKNFLAYVNDPERYIGQQVRHGGRVLVRDYKSKKWIEALFAYFVFGDKIVGPTGKDVVAFEDQKKAEKFAKNNGAIGVVRFVELRRSILAYLNDVNLDSLDADSVIVPQVIDMKNAPPGVKIK